MKYVSLLRCVFFLFIWLLVIPITFAQEKSKILPHIPFYKTKRTAEKEKLAATSDPLKKSTLCIKYAEKRLQELKTMVSQGKLEFIEKLVKDYEDFINEAITNIEIASNQGKDVTEALEAVERFTKTHTKILTELLDKVPEEAKPAIRHAIEVSEIGRNTALNTLKRIQENEIPFEEIERPEEIRRPEEIPRPEEIRRPQEIPRPGVVGRPGGIFGGSRRRSRGR